MAARPTLPRLLLELEASAAIAPAGDPTRSGAASAATAPGGDPTRSGAASAMAPYAALARLSLPRLLEAPAATAPGGDPTRAGAAIRERGLRVAADAGSLLRGLPEVHFAPLEFLLQTARAVFSPYGELANGEILARKGDPTATTLMGAGLVLRRGFTGASKLNRRGFSGMMIPRILLCALAFNGFCQACRDCYELCGLMAYAGRRYSPDNWEPFMECMVQHYREEMSLDFQG